MDRAVKAARRRSSPAPGADERERPRGSCSASSRTRSGSGARSSRSSSRWRTARPSARPLRGDVGPAARHAGLLPPSGRTSSPARSCPVDGPLPHLRPARADRRRRRPIVPWNYPTCLACWKLGPALATGCTVILKPSELTPLTAMKLGELAREVGFPPGRAERAPRLRRPHRRGPRPASRGGQDRLHRLGAHRAAAAPCLGGHQPEEADPGARGEEPPGRLRRCRHGEGGRGLLLGHLREQGRGLQRGEQGPRARQGARRLRGEAGRTAPGRWWWAIRSTRRPRWAPR